jgi:hypothetical protein
MNGLKLTSHAIYRAAQRNISESDIELVLTYGSEVPNGYLIRGKDFQALEREMKDQMRRLRRLVGKRLVVVDGRIITTFHATRNEVRRLLRD